MGNIIHGICISLIERYSSYREKKKWPSHGCIMWESEELLRRVNGEGLIFNCGEQCCGRFLVDFSGKRKPGKMLKWRISNAFGDCSHFHFQCQAYWRLHNNCAMRGNYCEAITARPRWMNGSILREPLRSCDLIWLVTSSTLSELRDKSSSYLNPPHCFVILSFDRFCLVSAHPHSVRSNSFFLTRFLFNWLYFEPSIREKCLLDLPFARLSRWEWWVPLTFWRE